MRHVRTLITAILLWLTAAIPVAAEPPAALPVPVTLELRHLEETYRVLDIVATQIWPGWTDYRQVPFLLNFENGLRVLVGHPNPPADFEALPEVKCAGRTVSVDRTNLVALELRSPLRAGGGPISFGQTADGRPIEVVDMKFTRPGTSRETSEEAFEPATTEDQILIYIHELFHCFQREHAQLPLSGNFRFNADINYAVYSEVEGLALARAYAETVPEKAIALLKDFLVARQLKRARSMSESQGGEESSDEFREGSATYAEVRTLEVLKADGFKPGLTAAEDPEYHGFARTGEILRRYPRRLERDASQAEAGYAKVYTYGCFQALLCQRYFPGWQESLLGGTHFFDRELGKRLPLSAEDRAVIEQRLPDSYPLSQIRERHAKLLNARDAAYHQVKARIGRVYILDFKRTGQFLSGVAESKGSYRIGLTAIYLDGLEALKFDDVTLSRVGAPAEIDQLYYIRIVDTDWKERAEALSISGDKQTDGTWKNAQVRTPLFNLTAPQIRIKESGNRVKVQILSRVK